MSRPHAAAIVEDAWHRQLERGLRRQGFQNRIIGHVGYGSTSFVRVFGRVLLSRGKDDVDDGEDDGPDLTFGGLRSQFGRDRGWRAFVTAPAMDVPVSVVVGEQTFHARSDRSGHIDATFRDHALAPGWQKVSISAQGAEAVEADVLIVGDDERHGLVSDIDDTVISTSLPRVMIAAWNTFVKHEGARSVVPGMAPMYRELLAEHPQAPIVYVSTGAWNTAPTLTRFLRRHGFP
ncbi:MAG: phosphatase domain-containing protein, partial [Lapillicoccus sp.]